MRRRDKQPLAFAGLWERWRDRQTGEVRETCAIVTTEANALVKRLHDRMPAILDRSAQSLWLSLERDPEDLRALLAPCIEDKFELFPVSTAVNNARNNVASILEPVRLA